MNKPVILTGIRSNNRITVGNFFGALLPTVDLTNRTTDEYQINLFVPDLHSFTTPIDHRDLYDNTINHLKLFVASGLDLNKDNVNLYRQSFIPAHSELMWILSCFTGFGELSRMTQFKDKSAKEQNISAGLFNYPILMAADILLYDASYVPVGDDQTQHLEFARDLALRFNSRFRTEVFKVPYEVSKQHAFFNRDQGLRIKDLVDPTKKMSKSDVSEKGIIFMDEDPNSAKKKILSATTDNLANINFDPINQPGISNLLTLHSLLTKQPLDDVIGHWKGQTSYKDLKEAVANSMYEFLLDFQEKYHKVESKQLEDKLKSSEIKMNEIANKKLSEVQALVGLRKN
jgi:tryptophanyl-tRNA synthetase